MAPGMRDVRPDSGGLPPRKGSTVGLLCSPICTSTKMLLLRCTGCPSKLASSSHLPKMQNSPLTPPLEWVDWFNNRRLLEPIGGIPPAEAEACYYAQFEDAAMAA
jgi:hypothetical protein